MAGKNEPASLSGDRDLIARRVFNAPRALVFKLWTDPAHIGQWWGPRGFTTTTYSMEVKTGGQWRYCMHSPDGVDFQNTITYLKVVEPKFIAYKLGGGKKGDSVTLEAEVTFADEGSKTHLTMRMTFPSAAARDHVVKSYGAVEGMDQTLSRLEEHLTHTGIAVTDARTQPSDRDFIITRVFDAPAELVFKAWAEPQHMARWWGPRIMTTPVCEMDVRPGGAYRIVMRAPDGSEYPIKGVFQELVPPQRIVMTMDPTEHPPAWHDMVKPNRAKGENNPAGIMLTTVTFEELSDGKKMKTKLTVRMRLASPEIRESMLKMGMTEGWSQSLERLAELLPTMA